MTVVAAHDGLGAEFVEYDGRRVVEEYGRPDSAHRAVRNGVGVIEMGYGVVEVTGSDRIEYVDNVVSNRVPDEDGRGCYALLLDPQGKVRADLYVYNAAERLLLFAPPSMAGEIAEEWAERTFIQDVEIREATTDFGVFGVHGPTSTEKIASVLNHAGAPEPPLSFVRGSMADEGVTVVASDAPTGEEGYEVVCGADAAGEVFDTLLTRGLNAAPFGHRTWRSLTLEAGTPLFDSELRDRIPNLFGLGNAVDYDKGCFVGQEVASRVENRGRPSRRLVGLEPGSVPEPGSEVIADGDAVGEVTRGDESPLLSRPVALALVDFDLEAETVEVDGTEASVVGLPFVEGSATSARLPSY
jgi:aminomethyltransferase